MIGAVRDFISMLERATDVPAMFRQAGFSTDQYHQFKERVLGGYRSPPRIALIGETGVGKSTTINALFNAGQPVSHVRSCTQIETELTVDGGKLRVFDMPGLGEDVDRDLEHMETYRRVLPECDAVLWVLKADVRAITNVQRSLHDLVDSGALNPHRLVIAINQIDLVQPGSWLTKYNMPDPDQEATVRAREDDVREKLARVIDLPASKIVSYSAEKSYGLPDLLGAIEQACDRSRMWLIQERANFLDFDSLAEVSRG